VLIYAQFQRYVYYNAVAINNTAESQLSEPFGAGVVHKSEKSVYYCSELSKALIEPKF